jgi:hypothetical protein
VAANYLMPESDVIGQFLTWVSLALGLKYGIEALFLSRLDEATEDEIIMMKNRIYQLKRR